MLKSFLISIFILIIAGNSFSQQADLSGFQPLKYNDKNKQTKYSLLHNKNSQTNGVLETSFLKKYLKDINSPVKFRSDGVNPDEIGKKYPLWIPITEIIAMHTGVCLFSNYVLGNEFAKISFKSVAKNFETGFVWDPDLFVTNFFAHPLNGSYYFNCARSNGYNYWESAPFAFGGSLTWELFMETEPPATNDIFNTTLSGIFLGEVTHRLSSLILDDNTSGFERIMRELGAGLIDIPRGVNRLFQNKSWKTKRTSYEREPLAMNAYYGVNWAFIENKKTFANGVVGFGLLYGNPFTPKKRLPMDFFKVIGQFNFGAGQPGVGDLEGYGRLFGKSYNTKKSEYLFGFFQHYDFHENLAYQIGAISFGVGWLNKYRSSKNSLLLSSAHLNLMPFGGSKSVYVDIVQRTYSFAGGMNAKLETSLNYKWGSIYVGYNFYWYLIYVGALGNEFYGIFRPKVVVNVTENLEVGAQFMLAHKKGEYHDHPGVNGKTQQAMLLLQYTIGDMNFLKSAK